MVSIVTGDSQGLFNTAPTGLGRSAGVELNGTAVSVHSHTGGLLLRRQDEFLVGPGLEAGLLSTYNSRGQVDGSGHGFHYNFDRSVRIVSASDHTVAASSGEGSVLIRTLEDGTEQVFEWNSVGYISTDGGAAHDYVDVYSGGYYEVVDTGEGGAWRRERYRASDGRLERVEDAQGNALTYVYDEVTGRVTHLQHSAGMELELVYDTAHPADIVALISRSWNEAGTAVEERRVSYTYEEYSLGRRLQSVTVDLTPTDANDTARFVTTYSYESGSSNRITGIVQQDYAAGASTPRQTALSITYSGERVSELNNGGQITRFSYDVATPLVARTHTTDVVTQVHYVVSASPLVQHTYEIHADSQGRLVKTVKPVVAGSRDVTEYVYDTDDNVIEVRESDGSFIQYAYDANGNRTRQWDSLGNTVSYQYSANLLVSETVYLNRETSPEDTALNIDASGARVTRYAYDSQRRLRFVVAADGTVTEHQYTNTHDKPAASRTYLNAQYTPSGLLNTTTLATWVQNLADKTARLSEATFSVLGEVNQITTSGTDSSGVAIAASRRTTDYDYDLHGQLRQVMETLESGVAARQTTVYTYDGLGRVVNTLVSGGASGSVVSRGSQTQYTDAAGVEVAIDSRGLYQTSTFDSAGRLVSRSEGSATDRAAFGHEYFIYNSLGQRVGYQDADGGVELTLYDARGRVQATIDSTRALTEYSYNDDDQLIRTTRYATRVDLTPWQAAFTLTGGVLTGVATLDFTTLKPAANTTRDRTVHRVYNAAGQLRFTVDGDYYVTQYRYNGAGEVVETLAHANMNATSSTAQTLSALETRYGSGGPGRHADDRGTRYFHDSRGRRSGEVDGQGYYTAYEYNRAGEVVRTIAYATPVTVSNDSVTPSVHADDQHTVQVYDARGQKVATVDPAGYVTRWDYDSQGQVKTETAYYTPLSLDLAAVDAATLTLAAVTPAGHGNDRVTRYGYNALGDVLWDYEENSRLGHQYFYETGGALQGRRYGEADYDAATDSIAIMTLGTSVELDNYRMEHRPRNNERGLVRSEATQHSGFVEGTFLRHEYDAAGNRINSFTTPTAFDDRATAFIDGAGQDQRFYYDTEGRLRYRITAVAQRDNNGDPTGELLGEVVEYEYNAFGEIQALIEYATPLTALASRNLLGGVVTDTDDAVKAVLTVSAQDRRTETVYNRRGLLNARQDAEALRLGASATDVRYYNAFGELSVRILRTQTTLATTRYDSYRYDHSGRQIARYQGSLTGVFTAWGGNPHPEVVTTEHSYDAFGRVIARTDGNGNTTTYDYDQHGRLLTLTDPEHASTVTRYDAFSRVVEQIDGAGQRTTFTYDDGARRLTTTHYLNPDDPYDATRTLTTTSTFNAFGEVVEMVNGLNERTVYQYDGAGNVASVATYAPDTPAPLTETTSDYDARNRLVSTIDGNGVETVYAYDSADRLLKKTVDPDGLALETRYRHDTAHRTQITIDANGTETHTVYDHNGRVSYVIQDAGTGGLKLYTGYSYSPDGLVLTEQRGSANNYTLGIDRAALATAIRYEMAYTYDIFGRRVEEMVDPNGLQLRTHYAYDANDNVVRRMDAEDHITYYAYNGRNEEVYRLDPLGYVTETRYDGNGNVSDRIVYRDSVATALSAWLAHPDHAGKAAPSADDIPALLGATPVEASHNRRYYDGAGRLRYQVDGEGYVVETLYDAAGRVSATKAYADAIDPTTQAPSAAVLDTDTRITRYFHDAAGRQQFMLNAEGLLTETRYDGNGNVIETVAYNYKFPVDSIADTVTGDDIQGAATFLGTYPQRNHYTYHVYDAANRKRYTQDAEGYLHGFAYDDLGRLTKTVTYAERYSGERTLAAMAAHGADPARDRVSERDYDTAGRLIRLYDGDRTLSGTAYEQYGYDAVGNRKVVADRNGNLTLYAYDGANRLTYSFTQKENAATAAPASGYVVAYDYDGSGHVVEKREFAQAVTLYPTGLTIYTGTFTEPALTGADRVTQYRYYANGTLRREAVGAVQPTGFVETTSTRYEYNAHGQRTAEIRGDHLAPAQQQRSEFDYDNVGNLIEERHGVGTPDAIRTTYGYDAFGHRIRTTDPRGHELVANSTGLTAQEQAALLEAHTRHATFDRLGNQIEQTDALNHTTISTYDAFGNLASVTDALGNKGYFTYDKNNRLILQIDPEGYVTEHRYDANDQLIETTRYQAALPTTFTINTFTTTEQVLAALPVTSGDQDPTTTQYQYDAQGNLIETFDGYYTERYQYDAAGNQTQFTNKLGGVFDYQYDAMGNRIVEQSPTVSTTVIDASGNAATASQRLVTERDYDAFGNVTHLREAAGTAQQRETVMHYDALNRETLRELPAIAVFDPVNKTTSTVTPEKETFYDAHGNTVEEIDADGARNLYYYDALNQLVAHVDPTGALTEYQYDANGKLVHERLYSTQLTGTLSRDTLPSAVANDSYREMTYVYDANGRRIQSISAVETLIDVAALLDTGNGYVNKAVITYTDYDGMGNLIRTIDGRGHPTFYFYDTLGQRQLTVDALGYVTHYSYDANGNVLREARYADALSAATFATLTGATLQALATTINVTDLITEANGAGQHRITEYTYDSLGRAVNERRLSVRHAGVNATTGAVTEQETAVDTRYQYDGLNNVTQVVTAIGEQTNYEYDALGRLTRQLDPSTAVYNGMNGTAVQTANLRAETQVEYDMFGQRSRVTRLGLSNLDDQITREHRNAQGQVVAEWDAEGNRTDYDVDAGGRILRQRQSATDVNNTSHSYHTYFTYDALDRITTEQIVDIVDEEASQIAGEIHGTAYNAFGDVESTSVNGIQQAEYRYDKLGNLFWTNDETGTPRVYLYDEAGNAVVEMTQQDDLSATPSQNISTFTSPDQMPGVAPTNVQMTVSFYDGRNQLTDVYQAPMNFTGLTGALTAEQQQQIQDMGSTLVEGTMQQTGSNPGGTSDTGWLSTNSVSGQSTQQWGNPDLGTQPGVETVLDPRTVNQATHGQDPLTEGGPWVTTTTTVNGTVLTPTQAQNYTYQTGDVMVVATVTTTRSYDAATQQIVEMVTTVTDTTVTQASTTGQPVSVEDDIDYLNNTAEVDGEEVTTTTPIVTTRTEHVETNRYASRQVESTTNTLVGGSIAINSGLVFYPSQTISIGYWWGDLGLGVIVPEISAYGEGPARVVVRAGFYPSLNVIYDNPNHLRATNYQYYDEMWDVVVEVYKNGYSIITEADFSGDTGDEMWYYGTIPSNIEIGDVDPSVQSATLWLSNGSFVQLSKVTYGAKSYWITPSNIATGNESYEYRFYNSTIQDETTLIGGVRGSNLSDPSDREYLYTSQSSVDYYQRITTNDTTTNYSQTDTAISIEQSNYLRNLVYNWVTGTANSNTIHRSNSYNAFGEVQSETDGRGNITQYDYNELGQLMRETAPAVDYTGEDGVVVNNFTPVTDYYVNAAGQTVGQRDANGHITSQVKANGRLVAQFNPDGGVERYYYDRFGNQAAVTNGINETTRYSYDHNNRLIRQDMVGGNYDSYQYDALGNRIAHTNGLGNRETYRYDYAGRVVHHRSFAGRNTYYTYAFRSDIGETGGYRKTTVDHMNGNQFDDIDLFGKIRRHTDMGGREYTYEYNNAGWLIHQESTAGQDIDYEYYNNGYLKEVLDHGISSYARFEYDLDGNRTFESYSQERLDGTAFGAIPYQVAHATYDALNRVTSVREDGRFHINYEYDRVGNRRRVHSQYYDLLANTEQEQDFYYTYDAMNRFTTTMGTLVGGAIVRGSTGYSIDYTAAGQRAFQYSTDTSGRTIRERYEYDANGFLTRVYINPNFNGSGTEALRAERVNNVVGEREYYREYDAAGTVTSNHRYTYDRDHNLEDDYDLNNLRGVDYVLLADGRLNYTRTYDNTDPNVATITHSYTYDAWDSYKQRQVVVSGVHHQVEGWRNGTSTYSYNVNGHTAVFYDHHINRRIDYINNHHGQTLRRVDYTGLFTADDPVVVRDFYYFNGRAVGDQGTDNVPSRVDYAQSLRGTEFERKVKHTRLIYPTRGGRRMSSGTPTLKTWYTTERRVTHRDIGTKVIPVTSADFDQNFQPINAGYPAATPGAYVVKSGDTLQGIAASLWGDSSLWYLLADANGLTGAETLTADTRLTVPNVVTNIHNNDNTFRPVDPGFSLGDTQPTLPDPPPPPREDGGCGWKQILVIVVAVVVTVLIQDWSGQVLTNAVGATAGTAGTVGTTTAAAGTVATTAATTAINIASAAIGAAAGSMVSQAVAISLGIQDGFSWKAVGQAAVLGGITAGVAQIPGLKEVGAALSESGKFLSNFAQGAVNSVVSQGIGKALGVREHFTWRAVATAGLTQGTLAHAGVNTQSGDLNDHLSAAAISAGVEAAVYGDDFDYVTSAGNAIGNVIGGYFESVRAEKERAKTELHRNIDSQLEVIEWDSSGANISDLSPEMQASLGYIPGLELGQAYDVMTADEFEWYQAARGGAFSDVSREASIEELLEPSNAYTHLKEEKTSVPTSSPSPSRTASQDIEELDREAIAEFLQTNNIGDSSNSLTPTLDWLNAGSPSLGLRVTGDPNPVSIEDEYQAGVWLFDGAISLGGGFSVSADSEQNVVFAGNVWGSFDVGAVMDQLGGDGSMKWLGGMLTHTVVVSNDATANTLSNGFQAGTSLGMSAGTWEAGKVWGHTYDQNSDNVNGTFEGYYSGLGATGLGFVASVDVEKSREIASWEGVGGVDILGVPQQSWVFKAYDFLTFGKLNHGLEKNELEWMINNVSYSKE